MLIVSDVKTRKFDQGVREFIAHFDQPAVMDRAWDEERNRHCIDLLKKEEREQIKEVLFTVLWKDISRGMSRGFAEWYKAQLAARQPGSGSVWL